MTSADRLPHDTRLLRDFASLAARLRAAGVTVDSTRIEHAIAAVAALGPVDRRALYWGTRLTLCSSPTDVRAFETVFAAWLRRRSAESATDRDDAAHADGTDVMDGADVMERPDAVTSLASGGGGADASDPDAATSGVGATTTEPLAQRDLRTLTDAERAEVDTLIAALVAARQMRPTRRYRTGGRRRIDPAGTFRLMLRNGGEPAHWRYRQRVVKPRRLTLLVDVSESMGDYSDALLRFGHAALVANPATTEVFTLGTRCTRVTRALAVRDPQRAMAALSAAEPYRGGGTRLGRCLRDFLRAWGGDCRVRSAVVVIASDGYDSGPAILLARQVARLSRLAYRLIWVNPQQGWPGFRPMAPGLVASLRHVDLALPGHSVAALSELAEVVYR